jgi:hypothetical protein
MARWPPIWRVDVALSSAHLARSQRIETARLLDSHRPNTGGADVRNHRTGDNPAVHEDETRAMILHGGIAMVEGMAGSKTEAGGREATRTMTSFTIRFWLFDKRENARAAGRIFKTLREMPEAQATFISVDVGEVIGRAEKRLPERDRTTAPI